MKKLQVFGLLIGCSLFLMACGGSSSDAGADADREEMEEMETGGDSEPANLSDAMTQAKEALEKAGMGQTKDPVNFRELQKLIPERLSGMEQSDLSGETTGAMGFNISKAEAKFTGEDGQQIDISIFDTGGIAMATMGLAAWANVTIDKEDSNGYERTTTIDGYKAFEKYSKRNQSGEISLFVNERFIVKVDGRKVEMDDLKSALEELDLDDLKDVK